MSTKQKILITGCGGMLCQAFYEVFTPDFEVLATDIDLNASWLKELDVRDYDQFRNVVEFFRPDYIFHLAALTDLEFCEQNPEEAYRTNALGTENSALLAKKFGATLIYISTAGIFDGKKDLYDDYDQPNPLNHYGRAKYAGEVFVQNYCDKFFVFRAGWMMGGGSKDKKFIKKIIQQIQSGKKELFVVNDLQGTPTYTYDFANNVREMIQTNFYGVYNMVCSGETSRLEVAKEILNVLKLTDQVKINEVSSSYFAKEYFVRRPDSEKLINRKLILRNMNKMRDWRIGLKEYLERDWLDKI